VRAVIAAALLTLAAPPRAAAEAPPLTEANLRAHKMLYEDGWFLVTSSSRAFQFARKTSVESSRAALERAARDTGRRASELGPKLKDDLAAAATTTVSVASAGTRRTKRILAETSRLAGEEAELASEAFRLAMKSFVRGNLSIARRTQKDREELERLPGGWFRGIKEDFSDIYERAESARESFGGKIEPQWAKSFEAAAAGFRSEYEESGKKKNSLLALGPIMRGYLKALYRGLAAPSAKTLARTAAAGGQGVFLPAAAAVIVTGRTVRSAGLTLYYAGRTGVALISPTLEGGVLAALALASSAAVPVTYAAGGTLGAVNQVAFTAAAPAAGAGRAAAEVSRDAGQFAGLLVYDAASGAARVALNQAQTGVVLGYNALTALPTHAALGVVDAAVFLAWDGPNLVVSRARGKVAGAGGGHSVGSLPVGAVVDLGALRGAQGVTVETVSEDPAVIRAILEKLPEDLRGDDEAR
jgi:hypothetical protein